MKSITLIALNIIKLVKLFIDRTKNMDLDPFNCVVMLIISLLKRIDVIIR